MRRTAFWNFSTNEDLSHGHAHPTPLSKCLRVTDLAAERVREIVANAKGPAEGIRIGIRRAAAPGWNTRSISCASPEPADNVVDVGGGKVFVNPQATLFLLGTEMDFEATKLQDRFVFRNPNRPPPADAGSAASRPVAPEALTELGT